MCEYLRQLRVATGTNLEVFVDVCERLVDPVEHARQTTRALRDQNKMADRQHQSRAPAMETGSVNSVIKTTSVSYDLLPGFQQTRVERRVERFDDVINARTDASCRRHEVGHGFR